jgi:ribosomal protein L28
MKIQVSSFKFQVSSRMSRQCQMCGKGYIMSTTRKLLRGKYNPTSKKRKYPNLQWTKDKSGKRVKVCTQCIRTIHKA